MLEQTLAIALILGLAPVAPEPESPAVIRVATFNASLNRGEAGALVRDLATGGNPQARKVAEIIQAVRPDVILINEFDYDAAGEAARLFRSNYLAVGQNGKEALDFGYLYTAPVNTGVASGRDLDGDGKVASKPGDRGYGNDSLGYGLFPGQYGMVIYSRFPIAADRVRDFSKLLWKEMPGALLPRKDDGTPWYSDDALSVFRLSSKGHWDVPIRIEGRDLHLLVSHPTPPAFDGPEDRNGKRNHDEIRIWADYLAGGERSRYLAQSIGVERLDPPSEFVVLGDLNADPIDGGSANRAIQQLLDHPSVDSSGIPRSEGGPEAAGEQGGANRDHRGDPAFDTADFDESVGNLRVDYVLPAKGVRVVRTGIFWPRRSAPDARLVAMKPVATSDHRLVWIDLEWPKK